VTVIRVRQGNCRGRRVVIVYQIGVRHEATGNSHCRDRGRKKAVSVVVGWGKTCSWTCPWVVIVGGLAGIVGGNWR